MIKMMFHYHLSNDGCMAAMSCMHVLHASEARKLLESFIINWHAVVLHRVYLHFDIRPLVRKLYIIEANLSQL